MCSASFARLCVLPIQILAHRNFFFFFARNRFHCQTWAIGIYWTWSDIATVSEPMPFFYRTKQTKPRPGYLMCTATIAVLVAAPKIHSKTTFCLNECIEKDTIWNVDRKSFFFLQGSLSVPVMSSPPLPPKRKRRRFCFVALLIICQGKGNHFVFAPYLEIGFSNIVHEWSFFNVGCGGISGAHFDTFFNCFTDDFESWKRSEWFFLL